jgi:chitinase
MRAAVRWSLALAVAACGGEGEGEGDDTGSTSADGPSSGASDPSASAGEAPTSAEGSSSASAPTSGPDPTGVDDTTTADDGPDDDSTGGEACVDDHRVVAFLANWTECPTAEQLAQYSHVVIAFAVTYTWDPGGNICDETCTIGPVDGCLGTLVDLVGQLHDAGIEVLVSFGGAGMGGIWEGTCGQMTKCWDHCVDQVDSLAAQLTTIVADNDLDGVDIDYEYCLNDASYTGFVEGLTTELRASLDAQFPGDHKLVTHAPMDSELEAGDPYYEIVANVAGDLDFLMPQYYNGGLSPFTRDGLASIQAHYAALVDGVFDGDASRVVFGYCIEPGCNPVATQPEATNVIETFDASYPDNGGIFFWAHPNDTDAWFSAPFRDHYDAICAP